MSFRLQGVGLVHANGRVALRDITLAAAGGERIAIVGPSGAGKTTLLRILATALRPSSGEAQVLAQSPWQITTGELKRLRSRIGLVHQNPPLPGRQRVVTAVLAGRLGQWPLWKAIASLIYPADIAGARAALARFDLGDRLFDRCDRLSGGQLQRAGIARVLYQQADLILADEPVSALDPALALQSVRTLVNEAEARQATLVASLHAVDLALSCFPRIIGLREGQVAFDLPAAQVTEALLRELYVTESGELPTLAGSAAGKDADATPEQAAPARLQAWG